MDYWDRIGTEWLDKVLVAAENHESRENSDIVANAAGISPSPYGDGQPKRHSIDIALRRSTASSRHKRKGFDMAESATPSYITRAELDEVTRTLGVSISEGFKSLREQIESQNRWTEKKFESHANDLTDLKASQASSGKIAFPQILGIGMFVIGSVSVGVALVSVLGSLALEPIKLASQEHFRSDGHPVAMQIHAANTEKFETINNQIKATTKSLDEVRHDISIRTDQRFKKSDWEHQYETLIMPLAERINDLRVDIAVLQEKSNW